MATPSSAAADNMILGQMTTETGLTDARSEEKSKGPFANAGKKANGKGSGISSTSKQSDDGRYERMLDGATGHNDGATTSTEYPTQKTGLPQKNTRGHQQERGQPPRVCRLKLSHPFALPRPALV